MTLAEDLRALADRLEKAETDRAETVDADRHERVLWVLECADHSHWFEVFRHKTLADDAKRRHGRGKESCAVKVVPYVRLKEGELCKP